MIVSKPKDKKSNEADSGSGQVQNSVASLVWMAVLQLLVLVAAIFLFYVLPPQMHRMFEEFGVDMPMTTKFLVAWYDNLQFLLVVLLVGIQSLVFGVGLALWLIPGYAKQAKLWNRITLAVWMIVLGMTFVAWMLPSIAIVEGLTGSK